MVFVCKKECRNYDCLVPHRWTTQGQSYNHTQAASEYSCGNRDYHGCPIAPQKKRKEIETKEVKETFTSYRKQSTRCSFYAECPVDKGPGCERVEPRPCFAISRHL
jgi:hypothetical protein